MGVDSFMVERCRRRCEHDQREIRNRSNVARISRCDEIPAMPGTSRCVLRMVQTARKREAAVLLSSESGPTLAFAGLWEGWKGANGTWIKTCTILTTTPNAVTSSVHDRMPVILDSADYDVW